MPSASDTDTTIIPLPVQSIAVAAPKEKEVPRQSLGRPGVRILREVAKYHQLTAEQLARILDYGYRFVQLECKKLTRGTPGEAEYLLSVPSKKNPTEIRMGNLPYVYLLGRDGRKILQEDGVEVWPRFHRSEEITRIGDPHSLAVNDVLINASKLESLEPDIVLSDFWHERKLNKFPLKVPVPHSSGGTKIQNLSPDLWLDIRDYDTRTRYCYSIEVNLTHVEQKRLRRTIRKYLYAHTQYRERFGTNTHVVVFIIQTRSHFPRRAKATTNPQELLERSRSAKVRAKRMQDFKRWTETELTNLGKQYERDMFRFTCRSMLEMSPLDLFCGNHFYSPFVDSPAPLITLRKAGQGD